MWKITRATITGRPSTEARLEALESYQGYIIEVWRETYPRIFLAYWTQVSDPSGNVVGRPYDYGGFCLTRRGAIHNGHRIVCRHQAASMLESDGLNIWMPHPMELCNDFDRIQITKDGWLHLWNSCGWGGISVKIDSSVGRENKIEGCSFASLEKD